MKIVWKPLDWNEGLAENAQKILEENQSNLIYSDYKLLSLALTKLYLLEEQGAEVKL